MDPRTPQNFKLAGEEESSRESFPGAIGCRSAGKTRSIALCSTAKVIGLSRYSSAPASRAGAIGFVVAARNHDDFRGLKLLADGPANLEPSRRRPLRGSRSATPDSCCRS